MNKEKNAVGHWGCQFRVAYDPEGGGSSYLVNEDGERVTEPSPLDLKPVESLKEGSEAFYDWISVLEGPPMNSREAQGNMADLLEHMGEVAGQPEKVAKLVAGVRSGEVEITSVTHRVTDMEEGSDGVS